MLLFLYLLLLYVLRSLYSSEEKLKLCSQQQTQKSTRTKLHVVHNWFEELKRLVPTD